MLFSLSSSFSPFAPPSLPALPYATHAPFCASVVFLHSLIHDLNAFFPFG